MFARGPGVLALVLGAVIAATALHRGSGLASSRRSTVPTPIPVPFRALLGGHRIATDAASGQSASVRAANLTRALVARRAGLFLDLQVQILNGSAKPQSFEAGSFYLVVTGGPAAPGTTIAAQAPDGLPVLGRGTLNGASTRIGWLAFAVPATAARYVVIWTDGDRLLTPATVAGVTVQATPPSSR